MAAVVYLITVDCGAAGLKFYVGKAARFVQRKRRHLGLLRKGTHNNRRLLEAWNRYGETAFVFSVLEEIDGGDVLASEQRHLDLILAAFGGHRVLNICRKCVDQRLGVPHTKKTRKLLSDIQKLNWTNEDYRSALMAALKIANGSPEARARNSAAQIVAQNRPEMRQRNSERGFALGLDLVTKARRKAANANPEVKARRRASAIAALADPLVRAKIIESNNDPIAKRKRHTSAAITNAKLEVKERRSRMSISVQSSQEYRQRQREIQLVVQNRPEVKVKKSANIRAALATFESTARRAATNARPEVIARRSAAAKAVQARLRAERTAVSNG